MNLDYDQDEERRASQQSLAEARRAIARDAARSQENKAIVAAMVRSVNLRNTPVAAPSEPLRRAVAAQLEIVEQIGERVKSAETPSEAQQWQTVQRNAFQDLRTAEEAAQEYEARQTQAEYNRATEQFLTLGGISFGVFGIVAGAVVSLLGHPYVGVPVTGGGIAFIKQALDKLRATKKRQNND